jgi:hypothetical protein
MVAVVLLRFIAGFGEGISGSAIISMAANAGPMAQVTRVSNLLSGPNVMLHCSETPNAAPVFVMLLRSVR